MDDVKDKFKDMMKKVNNPFSSSSGKFKGQGRVLGSSSGATYQDRVNALQNPANMQRTSVSKGAEIKSQSPKVEIDGSLVQSVPDIKNDCSECNSVEFNDFIPLISSAKGSQGGNSVEFNAFSPLGASAKGSQGDNSVNCLECPICGRLFKSDKEIMIHAESCLDNSSLDRELRAATSDDERTEATNKCMTSVGVFFSGGPSKETVEVVLKLLRNIIGDPSNQKFRRIRMMNPKIHDTVGSALGGVELLKSVGFMLQEENGEMWATLDIPREDQILLIKEAISLLETSNINEQSSTVPLVQKSRVEPTKFDRQVRVFFAVPENVASKIDLPDSFYNLTANELKREAELRKKKIADSQLLIPKSYKEKQALIAKKRYSYAIIRIQFPDGVLLQGTFHTAEATTAIYEFVSSSLKDPRLEFELFQPSLPRNRSIPRVSSSDGRFPTIEEADLVPATLVKCKPFETDSMPFTGLRNELLEIMEPLSRG